ncbi:CcdC family protein [Virgibacillus xinjiangensis]|uniref:CcdC family protein n=1 Tax=Virgibacillus xinjiangensis TaxID=393090 RepID=A0ABV7CRJ5_9BACI
MFWLIASTIVAACMASMMIVIRLRAAKKPASVRKIILPPLFMSTGGLMFIFPMFHINFLQVLEAGAAGMVCSIFLIKTTKFEVRGQDIYLIPSKYFAVILVALLVFRLVFKLIIGSTISFGETSGMFFILALFMILTWRSAMLYKYVQMERQLKCQTA